MEQSKLEGYEILDSLPGALIEIEFSSRSVVYMNIIALSVFEYSSADIGDGIPVQDIFLNNTELEKALGIVESFGLNAYQNHTPYSRLIDQDLYDFMLSKKDGSGFYGECQGSFVLDQDKVPVGIRLYIRDLTEQRLVEASLQSSEEKYRTLVEYSTDLIFLINDKYEILSVNNAAIKSLHKNIGQVQGKTLYELFPDSIAEGYKVNVDKAFSSGESAVYETTMPFGRGKKWLSTSINPVKDSDGKVTSVLGVSRDITERKLAEVQVEGALIRARKANKVKDQFIANISHEIRTPITSIVGFTARLKKSLGVKLQPKELEYFDSINRSSDRLVRTVDAILNVSQMEAGTLQHAPESLRIGYICKSICDELRPLAQKKGLMLEFLTNVEDDMVLLDESSIYQALVNLIQNAIKYTDEGHVRVQLIHQQQKLVLTITDTGIGISEEYRLRMFQLFSQESEGFTKEYQGLGLGLALTKRYLDRNRVKIQVDSKKDRGSIFTLTFPKNKS